MIRFMEQKSGKSQKNKRKKWIRLRHRVVRTFFFPFIYLAAKMKYHVKLDRVKKKDTRQYLILSNHQTGFDQFFISLCFPQPVYYVATEDIFSTGRIAKLLRWGFAPIPFKKSTNDVASVMTTMRVAHEGGTIGIFPEGNRTYHGRTVNIKDSIAVMAKKMKLPVALFKIEGGYGIQPRWSDVKRKGHMRAGISRIIEPSEAAGLSNGELYDIILKELYQDEYDIKEEYRSEKLAEHIERALYVCPECGLSEFESNGCIFTCRKCGKNTEYRPDKSLQGQDWEVPFRNEGEWYDYQEDYIRSLDMNGFIEKPAYEEQVCFSRVIPYKKKCVIDKNAVIRLYGDRYEIIAACREADLLGEDAVLNLTGCTDGRQKLSIAFKDIMAATAVGKNKVNFYTDKGIYQIKSTAAFNGLKYVNFYYHGVYSQKESLCGDDNRRQDGNSEFLGL